MIRAVSTDKTRLPSGDRGVKSSTFSLRMISWLPSLFLCCNLDGCYASRIDRVELVVPHSSECGAFLAISWILSLTPWDTEIVHNPPAKRLYPSSFLGLVGLVVARQRRCSAAGTQDSARVSHVTHHNAPAPYEGRDGRGPLYPQESQ